MYIELIHLEKMIIDGKDICLGITSDQLIEILGKPECIYENYGGKSWRHYYFDSELAFDYNLEGKLEFIELLCGHYGKLKPFIYGVSTFDVALAELVALLTDKNNGIVDDNEYDSYGFLNISVGIWKDAADDEYWTTIGIEIKDYYSISNDNED